MIIISLSNTQKVKLQEINKNPVKWAYAFLNTYDSTQRKVTRWTARWYQAEMLMDEGVRRVYRCGRRTGKCLTGDARILDYITGELVTVEDAYNNYKVHMPTMSDDYKIRKHFTNQILDNGIKEVFRVTTKSGRYIDATANHPMFTAKGWEEIQNLSVGSKIAIAKSLPYFGIEHISKNNLIDIKNKIKRDKDIPEIVFKLVESDLWGLLNLICDFDNEIIFKSKNIKNLYDLQHLLLRFGNNVYIENDTLKQVKTDDNIPGDILEFYEDELKRKNIFAYSGDIDRDTLSDYGKRTENDDIIKFSKGDFIFEDIVSIESLGEKQTYDFSVPLTGNFIANDFITHNTETMVVDSLYHALTHRNFRVLIVTPYETQVRLAFDRINELLSESPLIKMRVISNTKNPFNIKFDNNSSIAGFTTGASTGSGAASIRGQRADMIVMDEVDYMGPADFDSVMMIAGERSDIKIVMSSTPTGKRSKFYEACTNPNMHFREHYHPSMHNPGWNDAMEAEFRATLSDQGYVHEVLAEFGTQDTGVFDKEKLDKAVKKLDYAYNPLTYYQESNVNARKDVEENYDGPTMLEYDENHPAPYNPFRTMGVDWDKYQASSSILILEYNTKLKKMMVLKRYEMPRAEYSYDNAVSKIIELNKIYNPSFIYCDRGSGEYCIERLQIYGDEHPESGLKVKVKGWSFATKVDIQNPATGEIDKKPMKPFMVNQLQIAIERENLILSPYDEVLYKQLIDYEVEKVGANGNPIFTSKEEHFVDALGLANLAMVIEFKELTGVLEDVKIAMKMEKLNTPLISPDAYMDSNVRAGYTMPEIQEYYNTVDYSEHFSERQQWVKTDFVEMRNRNMKSSRGSWGSRSPMSSRTSSYRR